LTLPTVASIETKISFEDGFITSVNSAENKAMGFPTTD
jgi:hypothetical protein